MKTMFTLALTATTLIIAACGPADAEPPVAAEQPTPAAISTTLAGYDALLHANVGPLGFVAYDALAAEPDALNRYVSTLGQPRLLDDLEKEARLATLINAYNAFTLKLIVENYRGGKLESITELYDGKPWDQKLWNLAGQKISLNQLEHEMIRKEFPEEPRIHWAVVCAAYSCPPLRAEAYTAERLEDQLADQEKRVLLSGDQRFVDTSGSAIRVTQLFNWYGGDFGDWKQYVTDRLQPKEAKYGGFIPYDWKLNSIVNRPR